MLPWRNAFKETILSKSVDWFMRKPLEDDKDKVQFKANQKKKSKFQMKLKLKSKNRTNEIKTKSIVVWFFNYK